METIKNWFQDWSDACEYANECAPDLTFLTLAEPYAGLLWIAGGCFFLWAMNEARIKASRQARHFKQQPEAPGAGSKERWQGCSQPIREKRINAVS